MAITEWAQQEEDEPRFVSQLVNWVVTHKRVQMLSYYQGFGPGNTYELGLYPRTANTLRKKIRRANFLSYAEYNAGLLPPLPPKEKNARSTSPKRSSAHPADGPKTGQAGRFSAHRQGGVMSL